MLIHNLALVSKSKKLKATELSLTAAALQKQATRDLAPIWGIQATIDYFPDLKSVPLGYWPIIISDKIDDPNAGGYHEDKNHQPYSLVAYDESWQLTCSHEMLEMLVDPFGRKLVTSDSIKPGQGRVRYLVEVCDPCEDASFAYSVNGILLSDFYTPHYFDPVHSPSTRYSFTGALTKPREIKKGGYLSWLDPITKQWYQATYFGSKIAIKNITSMNTSSSEPLRSQMDRLTKNPAAIQSMKAAHKNHASITKLSNAIPQKIEEQWIEELKKSNIH